MLKLLSLGFLACVVFASHASAQSTAPYVNTLQIETQQKALNDAAKKAATSSRTTEEKKDLPAKKKDEMKKPVK